MPQLATLGLAVESDATSIARMSAALIEYGLPHAWTAVRVAAAMHRAETAVVVARTSDLLMGFAIMDFGDDAAHLNLLAVSTLARRQGIGSRLLSWLHDSALTAGTFHIRLEVRASNATAQRFYRAHDYRPYDCLLGYYSGRDDAVCMSRNLAVRPISH